VNDTERDVLSFVARTGESGWTDELTELHEAVGGAEHPIDAASRARALEQLSHFVTQDGAIVLEVGISSGWFLRDARRAFPRALVIGSDYVAAPLERLASEMPGVPLLQLDLTRCPLHDACVDAVVALNVLEHIADDGAAVREIHRILKPGGAAVIELPAGPSLFDVHDKVLMHHRRYTLAQAVGLFERSGFRVRNASHLGFFVYPAFAAAKLRGKRHLTFSDAEQREVVARSIRRTRVSRALKLAVSVEQVLGRIVDYPIGVRCVFTAVKSDSPR
jgi:SAM-dependent methyltransferase